MKVLIVSEYENGPGAAVAAHRLAEALVARLDDNREGGDYQVSYAFKFPSPVLMPLRNCAKYPIGNDGRKSPPLEKPFDLRVHQYFSFKETTNASPGRFLWRPLATMSAGIFLSRYYAPCEQGIRRLIKSVKFDVVNFHNVSFMLDHDFVSELSQELPVVWTLHDCHAALLRSYSFKALDGTHRVIPRTLMSVHRDARERMMRRAGNLAFVAPSKWLADLTRETYGTRFPVHHIPYGLDAEQFFPIPKWHARTLLSLEKSEELTLLFIASSLENERKNLRVLLDALALVPRLPVRLLCLGDAAQTGLVDDRVKYLGKKSTIEDLRTAYCAADVTVITSLIDNLPNTVMESLFCGTPVLGAKCGGIPDMVREGTSGWLFAPYSAQQLADQITELVHDRGRIASVAENCATFARRKFSHTLQAERYEALFREACEKNHKP